jgi:hypothetical protein
MSETEAAKWKDQFDRWVAPKLWWLIGWMMGAMSAIIGTVAFSTWKLSGVLYTIKNEAHANATGDEIVIAAVARLDARLEKLEYRQRTP